MFSSRRKFLQTMGATAALASGRANSSILRAVASSDEKTLRAQVANDPLRPRFHLLPEKNWMNDPNGPTFWHGQYHMFFQYNPNAAVWGDMHWAHAISEDMIHWRPLPVALSPTPDGDDADGCFTGSLVDDNGTATIIYTGVKSVSSDLATLRDGTHNFREVQCLATSADPELKTWTKWKQPILQAPKIPGLTGFRDPFVWRDANGWYMGVGSGIAKKGGSVLLFRSKDLRQWEYLHPLASGKWTGRESVNPVDSGEMWECPDFFPLGTKHVLLYSTARKVIWETGTLDPKELVFHSERTGILDHGAYYAQKTQLDAKGNRILWGWIPETRPEAEYNAAGWAGCMSLPRILSLDADGDLVMRFADETRSLRDKDFLVPPRALPPPERIDDLRRIELESSRAEVTWNTAGGANALSLSDDTGPWWQMELTTQGATSVLNGNGTSIELPGPANAPREFHLFVDGSVAELICDSRHAITSRIYRVPDGPLHIKVGAPELSRMSMLEAWQLKAISYR
jgi:beta-fructofuranosidase